MSLMSEFSAEENSSEGFIAFEDLMSMKDADVISQHLNDAMENIEKEGMEGVASKQYTIDQIVAISQHISALRIQNLKNGTSSISEYEKDDTSLGLDAQDFSLDKSIIREDISQAFINTGEGVSDKEFVEITSVNGTSFGDVKNDAIYSESLSIEDAVKSVMFSISSLKLKILEEVLNKLTPAELEIVGIAASALTTADMLLTQETIKIARNEIDKIEDSGIKNTMMAKLREVEDKMNSKDASQGEGEFVTPAQIILFPKAAKAA